MSALRPPLAPQLSPNDALLAAPIQALSSSAGIATHSTDGSDDFMGPNSPQPGSEVVSASDVDSPQQKDDMAAIEEVDAAEDEDAVAEAQEDLAQDDDDSDVEDDDEDDGLLFAGAQASDHYQWVREQSAAARTLVPALDIGGIPPRRPAGTGSMTAPPFQSQPSSASSTAYSLTSSPPSKYISELQGAESNRTRTVIDISQVLDDGTHGGGLERPHHVSGTNATASMLGAAIGVVSFSDTQAAAPTQQFTAVVTLHGDGSTETELRPLSAIMHSRRDSSTAAPPYSHGFHFRGARMSVSSAAGAASIQEPTERDVLPGRTARDTVSSHFEGGATTTARGADNIPQTASEAMDSILADMLASEGQGHLASVARGALQRFPPPLSPSMSSAASNSSAPSPRSRDLRGTADAPTRDTAVAPIGIGGGSRAPSGMPKGLGLRLPLALPASLPPASRAASTTPTAGGEERLHKGRAPRRSAAMDPFAVSGSAPAPELSRAEQLVQVRKSLSVQVFGAELCHLSARYGRGHAE
jgi:hypothetical protein